MQNIVTKLQSLVAQPKSCSIKDLQNTVMSDRFKSQLNLVQQLSEEIDILRVVTPVNALTEKVQFLQYSGYAPTFEYDQDYLHYVVDQFTDKGKFLWQEYDFTATPRKLLIELLNRRIHDLQRTAELADSILAQDYTWAEWTTREKYGFPSQELIGTAYGIANQLTDNPQPLPLDEPPILSPQQIAQLALMIFDADAIKYWLEWSLDQYGFDIPVQILPTATTVDITYDANNIIMNIPEMLTVDGIELLKTNLRVVECITRDAMNREALLRPFGSKASIGHMDNDVLTKGHAELALSEFRQKYLGETLIIPDPWYVIAMDHCIDSYDFTETVSRIYLQIRLIERDHNLALARAWNYVYSTFRGSVQDGDGYNFVFTKDKATLEGYFLARDLVAVDLGHWLELGGITPEEMLLIAQSVDFQPEDIVYRHLDTTGDLCKILLSEDYEV